MHYCLKCKQHVPDTGIQIYTESKDSNNNFVIDDRQFLLFELCIDKYPGWLLKNISEQLFYIYNTSEDVKNVVNKYDHIKKISIKYHTIFSNGNYPASSGHMSYRVVQDSCGPCITMKSYYTILAKELKQIRATSNWDDEAEEDIIVKMDTVWDLLSQEEQYNIEDKWIPTFLIP